MNPLLEFLEGRKPSDFVSKPRCFRDGDFLTYYFRDADYYAERVDEVLTVYLDPENHDLVGFKLKGVVHLLKTLGDFSLEVRDGDGKLMLGMLFLARIAATSKPADEDMKRAWDYYHELARKTQSVPVDTHEMTVAA